MRIRYPKDCENKWHHEPDGCMCGDVLFEALSSLSVSTFLVVEVGQRTRPVKHSVSDSKEDPRDIKKKKKKKETGFTQLSSSTLIVLSQAQ